MGIIAAAEAATSTSHSNSSVEFLLLIVIMIVGVYFLMIRPQKRRQQAAAKQQNTVEPGALVRTTAGMYATVVEVDGDDVVLEVAPGVEFRYLKRAVMDVITPGDEVGEEVNDADYEEDDAQSAEDGIDDSHEDAESFANENDLEERASANGTKAKSDSDVF